MKIIGLTGKARSGKDTLGGMIHLQLAERGIDAATVAFADPIKWAIDSMLGGRNAVIPDHIKDITMEGIGKSPRQLYQLFGTEFGREMVHPDLWLLLMENRLGELDPDVAIITDVRFDNEAKWIREMGGEIHLVARNAANGVNPHKSEDGIGVEHITHMHDNNGKLHHLEERAKNIAESIFKSRI